MISKQKEFIALFSLLIFNFAFAYDWKQLFQQHAEAFADVERMVDGVSTVQLCFHQKERQTTFYLSECQSFSDISIGQRVDLDHYAKGSLFLGDDKYLKRLTNKRLNVYNLKNKHTLFSFPMDMDASGESEDYGMNSYLHYLRSFEKINLDISEFSTGKTVHWLPAKNGQSIYFHDFKMNDSYSSSGLFWSSFLTPFIQHNSVLPSALETVFPDSKPIPHETVNLVAEMLVFFNHFAIEFEIDTLSRLSYKPSKRRNGVLESTNVNEFSQFVVSDEKNNQHQQEREEEEDTHSLEFFEGESIEVEVYSESQVNRNEIELNETETNTNSTSQNSTSNANNTNANTNANTNTNAFNQQPPLTTRQTKLYVGNSGFISSILYGSSFRVVLNGRVPVRLVGNIVRALTEYLQDVITIEEYYTILKGLGNDTLQFTVSHSNGRNFLTESDTFKTNNTLELVEYLNKNNGRKFSNGSDCNVYQLVDSSIPLAIRVRNFGGTKEFASFQSTQCTSSLLPPFEVLLLMSNVLIAGSLIALVLASGCVGMLCWFLFGAITKKLHAQGRLSVPSFVNYTTIRLTLLTFSFSGRQQIVRFESEDAVPLAPVVGDENGNNNNDENNNNNDEGERNNNENNDLNDENSNNNNNNDMSDRDTNGDQNVQNEESSESERENRD